jgi:hypothetical protein
VSTPVVVGGGCIVRRPQRCDHCLRGHRSAGRPVVQEQLRHLAVAGHKIAAQARTIGVPSQLVQILLPSVWRARVCWLDEPVVPTALAHALLEAAHLAASGGEPRRRSTTTAINQREGGRGRGRRLASRHLCRPPGSHTTPQLRRHCLSLSSEFRRQSQRNVSTKLHVYVREYVRTYVPW